MFVGVHLCVPVSRTFPGTMLIMHHASTLKLGGTPCIHINDCRIKEVYEKNQFILDPHTATAFGAIKKNNDLSNLVALGTAHPYKFFETVKEAIGKDVSPPKQLEKIVDKDEKFDILENNISQVKKYILNKI